MHASTFTLCNVTSPIIYSNKITPAPCTLLLKYTKFAGTFNEYAKRNEQLVCIVV